jgi:hypothetical protein
VLELAGERLGAAVADVVAAEVEEHEGAELEAERVVGGAVAADAVEVEAEVGEACIMATEDIRTCTDAADATASH